MRGSIEWIKVIPKKRGGTGLGLSIVKHGALLHNAKVTVESDTGRGTRWRSSLRPLNQSEEEVSSEVREIRICMRGRMRSNPENRWKDMPV